METNTTPIQARKGRNPTLQISLEQKIISKIEALAIKEDRSISSMGRVLINRALAMTAQQEEQQ